MNANWCKNNGFEDLIVSYIYDEATADERRRLETHILDCSSCMEEFAGLSNARLSVFEWQKEAFSGVPTPVFSLPQVEKASGAASVEDGSKLGWLQGLISGLRGPAIAFASVSLLIVGGLTFIFLSRGGTGGQPAVATNPPSPGRDELPKRQPPAPDVVAEAPRTTVASESRKAGSEVKAITAAVPVRTARPARNLTARGERSRRVPAAGQKAPVLSDFDEPADGSLRLSDLFADGVDRSIN